MDQKMQMETDDSSLKDDWERQQQEAVQIRIQHPLDAYVGSKEL